MSCSRWHKESFHITLRVHRPPNRYIIWDPTNNVGSSKRQPNYLSVLRSNSEANVKEMLFGEVFTAGEYLQGDATSGNSADCFRSSWPNLQLPQKSSVRRRYSLDSTERVSTLSVCSQPRSSHRDSSADPQPPSSCPSGRFSPTRSCPPWPPHLRRTVMPRLRSASTRLLPKHNAKFQVTYILIIFELWGLKKLVQRCRQVLSTSQRKWSTTPSTKLLKIPPFMPQYVCVTSQAADSLQHKSHHISVPLLKPMSPQHKALRSFPRQTVSCLNSLIGNAAHRSMPCRVLIRIWLTASAVRASPPTLGCHSIE